MENLKKQKFKNLINDVLCRKISSSNHKVFNDVPIIKSLENMILKKKRYSLVQRFPDFFPDGLLTI